MQTWDLRLGDFDFSPAADYDGVSVIAQGLIRGRVVPVVTVINTLLQDGAFERVGHHENRDQQIIVTFCGTDAQALAEAEATLFREVGRGRNQLTWTPADGFGPATVFEVLWAALDFTEAERWAAMDAQGVRTYLLTMRALPFGMSVDEVVDEGLTAGAVPSTAVISDGTSLTGWSGGSPAIDAGRIRISAGNATSTESNEPYAGYFYTKPYTTTYTFAAPVDFTATPYLTLEVDVWDTANQFALNAPQVLVDGVEVPLAATTWITATGRRCTYVVSDSSATTVTIKGDTRIFTLSSIDPTAYVLIDNVSRSNQPPVTSSTARQTVRSIEVGGSARTQGALSISHATKQLGTVVAYTCPALSQGYAPDLRRWRASGGVQTADTATVSGTREAMGSDAVFNTPAGPLPRGGYVLMARMRSTSGTHTGSLTWRASTKVGSTLFGQQSGTSAPTEFTTSSWTMVTLGGMTLPPTDVPNLSAATVQIEVDGGLAVEWDEMWLFYLGDDSALTVVRAGTGTTNSPSLGTRHNRLWIDTPTLARPYPAVWLGTLEDRSDAFHAGEKADSWGVHSFPPGEVSVFVVTTVAENPVVSLRYRRRWLTHAAS